MLAPVWVGMIAGLDSSADRPSAATADEARNAGVGLWCGYLATQPNVGLYSVWDRSDFDNARRCGGKPIAFCSGRDDPVACRDLAAAWDVRLCVDVESGIRDDGPWVQGWLDASGAGLYGLPSVHNGRRAAFHVVAWYRVTPPACGDPGATWPSWLARPDAPAAWQFCGTHTEFGLSVDRGWYDDWFGNTTGGPPDMTDEQWQFIQGMNAKIDQMWSAVGGDVQRMEAKVDAIAAATGLDPATLAAAVAKVLGTKLSA